MSSKRFYGPRKIEFALDKETKSICKKKDFKLLKLILEWDKIVNKTYADFSKPVSIRSKQLTLEVYANSILLEMQYDQLNVMNNINGYFGEKIIDKVKLTLRPKQFAIQKIKKRSPRLQIGELDLSDISDPKLVENLKNLAAIL